MIKISKTSESAVLDVVHVLRVEIIVRNDAIAVVVTSIVERDILSVVLVGVSHMISNDINHNPDVLCMASINKRLQGRFTSEMFIDLSHVFSSISVELIWIVIRNRRDPNSIETHVLDVSKIVLNSFEVTTTVVWLGIQIASRSSSITQSKSISNDLINVSSFPFLSSFSRNTDCK